MKAFATASLIFCLGTVPVLATEPAMTQQTFDGWYTRDTMMTVKAAVRAEVCGVRSFEWTHHVLLAVAFESGKIASLLWPSAEPNGGLEANRHAMALLAGIGAVVDQEMHRSSDPADCRGLEKSGALTQIDGILLDVAQDRYGSSIVADNGMVR